LCHQHAYVSSASLPALPFLLRALDQVEDTLKVEVLDILVGFAECTAQGAVSGWQQELRLALLAARPRVEPLTSLGTPPPAVGSLRAPGPLYGVSGHPWQALGVVATGNSPA